MFTFNRGRLAIENTTIVDTDGSTFWVGCTAVSPAAKAVMGRHAPELLSAFQADCEPAALVLGGKNAKTPPLIRVLLAQALTRQESVRELACEMGVTTGYLMQLWNGRRRLDQISDEFANLVATVVGLPRLVVLYLAGRFESSHFAELGETGEVVARDVTQSALQALAEASRVFAAAEERVIQEERRVKAARTLPLRDAGSLHEEVAALAALYPKDSEFPEVQRLQMLERTLRSIAFPESAPLESLVS